MKTKYKGEGGVPFNTNPYKPSQQSMRLSSSRHYTDVHKRRQRFYLSRRWPLKVSKRISEGLFRVV